MPGCISVALNHIRYEIFFQKAHSGKESHDHFFDYQYRLSLYVARHYSIGYDLLKWYGLV